MFPGMGKIDPRKLQGMMKQMGINQNEIDAKRVIIETESKKIIIDAPNVQKITMAGQESYQISGSAREEPIGFSDEDVNLVIEKTGKSKSEVLKALNETGDIAEAIIQLS
jgi:nascent polypeptide-associated complex subunit alpha